MRYDIYVRLRDAMDEFVESEHPRDDDGKFTDKNGGGASGESVAKLKDGFEIAHETHAESSPAKYQPLPDEIKINDSMKKTENSNGARISKSEKGTRKFWDWFGNSKATDDENRPLELYHGTDATFGNFAVSNVDDAYFFTPSRAVARRFTSKKDVIETIPGTNIIAHIDNPGIKRVYLKMENVAEYDGETLGAGEERDWRIKADKAQGRDGVIIRNADTGNGIADEYIVFDPKNIKYVDDFLEDAE